MGELRRNLNTERPNGQQIRGCHDTEASRHAGASGHTGRFARGLLPPSLLRTRSRRRRIHRVTVSQHLHRSGVTMRRQGLNNDDLFEAARLYEGGSSLARVAEWFGVDPKTISSGLSRMGVRIRDSHGRVR